MTRVYTATRATDFEVLQHSTQDLLAHAAEFHRLNGTKTACSMLEMALSMRGKIEQIQALHADDDQGQLPQNVVAFPAKGRVV